MLPLQLALCRIYNGDTSGPRYFDLERKIKENEERKKKKHKEARDPPGYAVVVRC